MQSFSKTPYSSSRTVGAPITDTYTRGARKCAEIFSANSASPATIAIFDNATLTYQKLSNSAVFAKTLSDMRVGQLPAAKARPGNVIAQFPARTQQPAQ